MLGAMAKVASKPSAVIETRVIYCGDNLEQLRKLPDACVDLIYIDPPFNSNRNYEVFWGETKEKRAFADRHASTQAHGNIGRRYGVVSDSILFYTKNNDYTWNQVHTEFEDDYVSRRFSYADA